MSWACDPGFTTVLTNSYSAAGPAFAQVLQTFLAAQCALVGDHLWPDDATEKVLQDPNYDFLVVGAGSAGAVVANRLSEIADWKVLLIEAGGNPTMATEIPQLFFNNFNTPEDWGYKTEPQEGACRGYKDNRCAWPRGKTLGGCSSINAMFYVRANKADYNEWADLGNSGWSYDDVHPLFKKSEKYSGEWTEDLKTHHSREGYLNVDNDPIEYELEKMVLKAAAELGFNVNKDVNGDSQIGVAKSMTTIKDGVRQSTARSFLSPIKDRTNLHVMKNAYATKLLFKPNSNIVNGVLVNKNGKNMKIYAKKEVIVSGGSINTPQLLMLSGIGPADHLKDLNIEVKADLAVGENLEDHVFVPFYLTMPGNNSMNIENIVKTFVHYILTKKGPLSDIAPHKVISFVNTTDTNSELPDIQFHYLFFPPGLYNLLDVLEIHGLKEEIQEKYKKINDDNFILMAYTVLLRPKSKGKILLKSNDPNEHPLIYANYFKDPEDMHTILRATKMHTLELDKTKAFKEMGFKLNILDLDECKNFEKDSDEYLKCYCRHMTFSLYHPTGTAKMGPDHDNKAVLDPELRVRNIKRLRVVDASIMPIIVRGNTNAPSIMIGEKGAELIKKAWLNKHSEL